MIVNETFYRGSEIAREDRCLPASIYNAAHLLVARASEGSVFVPVRNMQYLAVLDAEEFIFVDRNRGRLIELAWRAFTPYKRQSLDAPVPYTVVYYSEEGAQTMQRLQGEFTRALNEFVKRRAVRQSAAICKLPVAP